MSDFFSSKINYQKISHSYLFECDGSVKSNELIDNLVKQVLCTNKDKNFQCCQKCKSCHSIKGLSNPDYVEVFPDDKEKIGIGSLRGDQDKNRGIINILSETALLSEAKIVKINNADLMTEEAQNYLLKILEEPPNKSYIFLLSARPHRLKPTILSRTTKIKIPPISFEKLAKENKQLDKVFYNSFAREIDISSLPKDELNNYLSLYEETIESIEEFNYTKHNILNTWNDDYLKFRLGILRETIFSVICEKLKNKEVKQKSILSTLDENRLFLFLEELITFQSLLANKVAVNRKIQLDSILDLIQ